MKVQVQEFQGLYQATAVERDKLTELLSLLQSRLVFEILSCEDCNIDSIFVKKRWNIENIFTYTFIIDWMRPL